MVSTWIRPAASTSLYPPNHSHSGKKRTQKSSQDTAWRGPVGLSTLQDSSPASAASSWRLQLYQGNLSVKEAWLAQRWLGQCPPPSHLCDSLSHAGGQVLQEGAASMGLSGRMKEITPDLREERQKPRVGEARARVLPAKWSPFTPTLQHRRGNYTW